MNIHIQMMLSLVFQVAFLNLWNGSMDSQHVLCEYLRKQGITTQIPTNNVKGHEWSLETFQNITEDGMTKSGPYLVRLLTFIPGKIFTYIPYLPGSLFNIGKFVGRLHKEMQGFHHNISENETNIWKFHKTSALRNFKHVLASKADIKSVEEVTEAYEQNVSQKLDSFTKGVIHGDLSDQNIIVYEVPGQSDTPLEERVHDVAGLIDFAHISDTYRVFDIAVCIAYNSLSCSNDQQLNVGGHILAGYYLRCSLNKEEFDALKILICVQLCQTLVYGELTYKQQPGNKYILATQTRSWPFLHKLWKIPSKQLYERWKKNTERN